MKHNDDVHPPSDKGFCPYSGGKIADGFQSKIPADIFGGFVGFYQTFTNV
jgi:hypothetical protein